MSRTRDLLLVWCMAAATFTLGALVASCEPDLTAAEEPPENSNGTDTILPSAAELVSADSANVLDVGSDELLYVAPGAGERGEQGEQGEPGPEGPQGAPGLGLDVRQGWADIPANGSIPLGLEIPFDGVHVYDILMFQCHKEDGDFSWMRVPCEAQELDNQFRIIVDMSGFQPPDFPLGDHGSIRAVLVGTFD